MKIEDIQKESIRILTEHKAESDCVEYKKSERQKDKILKTACAFANNLMNKPLCLIFLGVEEKNDSEGKSTPVLPILGFREEQIEKIENELSGLLSEVRPNIAYRFVEGEMDGRYFIAIAIEPQGKGPFATSDKAFKDPSISLKPGRYVRVGRESRIASIREEYELIRKFSLFHFSSELNETATIDDLSWDYMKEYLARTSSRENTEAKSKEDIVKALNLCDPATDYRRAYNFAVLMFAEHPDAFIKGSFVEVIRDSKQSGKRMESKPFTGPIWRQTLAVLQYLDETVLNVLTIRETGKPENRKLANYPYEAVEELVTNAVVHKDYENPKTISIYVKEDELTIVNHNRPLPPITYQDLNKKDFFPDRDYLNPEIREMFKSLDLIESYGSGIGEAKKAMRSNGSPDIHYEEYDEQTEMTTVRIPINEEYVRLSRFDVYNGNSDIEAGKSDISPENQDIEGKIKAIKAKADFIGKLLEIHLGLKGKEFSRKDVVTLLNCAPSSASCYLDRLARAKIILPISGKGKGVFRFDE
jgi:predicted HTH transcriptional regulator